MISPVRFLLGLYVRRRPPVLVYQMGKVGSMSIAAAVRGAGHRRVFRTHRLVPSNYRHDPFGQRAASSLLRRRFVGRDTQRIRIISPVREPVSRNVSGFFQNLHRFVDDPQNTPTPELQRLFLECYPHRVGIDWFDAEMRVSFGIDVYSYPFDPGRGHATVGDGRVDLLLFKIELPDDTIAALLTDFLDLDIPTLPRVNAAAARGRRHESTYDDFRRTLVLPDTLSDAIYESKFARHFYSRQERRSARDRWATGAARPATAERTRPPQSMASD